LTIDGRRALRGEWQRDDDNGEPRC